jgi:hypothetical protein
MRIRNAINAKVLAVLFLSSLLTLSVFSLQLIGKTHAQSESWLSGFKYRMPITVGRAPGAGVNYVVPINVGAMGYPQVWVADDTPTISPSQKWEGANIYAPSVISNGTGMTMYYGGQEASGRDTIGVAWSNDGLAWTKYSDNPVLTGIYGNSWDSSANNDPSVIDFGNGTQAMWYVGTVGSFATDQIGLATSNDYVTWTRNPSNPVLPYDESDGGYTTTPSVMIENGVYRMWYGTHETSFPDMSGYCVRYAESLDGVNWERRGQVLGPMYGNPRVVRFNSTHLMMAADYCYGAPDISPRRMDTFFSTDGIHWTGLIANSVVARAWKPYGELTPELYQLSNGTWVMYFGGITDINANMQRIGLATLDAKWSPPVDSVGVSLHLNGEQQEDFDDVNFTGSDGIAPLSYWRENFVANQSALEWVKIPYNLSSTSCLIYVYWGNSTASSASNGFSTFPFFDDFDDNIYNTSLWRTVSGSPAESGGFLNVGNSEVTSNFFINAGSKLRANWQLNDAQRPWQLLACTLDGTEFQGFWGDGTFPANPSYVLADGSPKTAPMQKSSHASTTAEFDWFVSGGIGQWIAFRNESRHLIYNFTTNVPDSAACLRFLSKGENQSLKINWVFATPENNVEPTLSSSDQVQSLSPTFSNLFVSSTIANSTVLFSSRWSVREETSLSAVFSWNGTGRWESDSIRTLSSPYQFEVAKTLPATVGQVVGWKWLVQDTKGYWNSTPIQTLTTTGYKITVTIGEHGVVWPNGVLYLCRGASQTFDITAFPDYDVKAVWVNESSLGPLGVYTLTNLRANYILNVSFEALPDNNLQVPAPTNTPAPTPTFVSTPSSTAPPTPASSNESTLSNLPTTNTPTPEAYFRINDLNLGTVFPNGSLKTTLNFNCSLGNYTLTGISLPEPFQNWLNQTGMPWQLTTYSTSVEGHLTLQFDIPENATASTYGGEVSVSVQDSLGKAYVASARIAASVSTSLATTNQSSWLHENMIYAPSILAATTVVAFAVVHYAFKRPPHKEKTKTV